MIKAYLDHPFSLDTGYPGLVGSIGPEEHPVIGYEGTRAECIREFTDSESPSADVLTEDGWWSVDGINAVHK